MIWIYQREIYHSMNLLVINLSYDELTDDSFTTLWIYQLGIDHDEFI